MSASQGDLQAGQKLADRFEIEEPLDLEDAVIYRARDTQRDAPVAIRIVDAPGDRSAFLDRIRRAEALAHPNVLRVYGGDVLSSGEGWLATDPIEGPTLARVLAREGGAVDSKRAVQIARQLATALQAAHRTGLVHGRLDPWHVRLVDAYGSPDWAIITGFEHREPEPHEDYRPPDDGAPVAGHDLWALGAVIRKLATGAPPEDRLRPGETLPAPLDGIVPRLLRADPSDRPSAEAVVLHIDGSSAFKLGGVTGEQHTESAPANAQIETAAQPLFFLIGGLVAAAVMALLGGLGFLWAEKKKEEHGGEHVLVAEADLGVAATRALPLQLQLPSQARVAFLAARAHAQWGTPESATAGLDELALVLETEPDSAVAHALASQLHATRALYAHGAWEPVVHHARQALELDPAHADARASLALARLASGDASALRTLLSVAHRTDSPTVRRWASAALTARGELEEAAEQARRAVALDPLSGMAGTDLARSLWRLRRPDAAHQQVVTVLRRYPELVEARRLLGHVLVDLDRPDDALEAFDQIGDDAGRVLALARLDRLDAARAALRRLRDAPPAVRARAHLALGDRATAVALLREAGSRGTLTLPADPVWDDLR